jgi:chemotaxis protein methyltransferase CheR
MTAIPSQASAVTSFPGAPEHALSPEAFGRFARYNTSELGIRMPESKITMIQSRLMHRVRELRLTSVDEYRKYFFDRDHAVEREHFINAVTTNKTDFFREPEHFRYLIETVLPALPRPFARIWSAGCSSGEEPYTISMVLSEYARRMPGFDFAIVGSDISTKVLNRARDGIYQQSQVEPVPAGLRVRYLLQSRDRSRGLVRIAPDLRRKVTFRQLNFMDVDYGMDHLFDVIFFRNVMIYFDKATQETVLNKLSRYLAPGGYLFAGHSESLAGLEVPFQFVRSAVFRDNRRTTPS